MAVVEPIGPIRSGGHEEHDEPDRVNVVRLIEFLGPVSPELVLIDPGLADRARALLPDIPSIHPPRRREVVEPTLLHLPPRPRRRGGAPGRLAAVALIAGGALAATAAISWSLGRSARDAEPTTRAIPPVAAPAPLSPEPSPAAPAPSTNVQSPRFVWPAEPGAAGYRVALYQDGRQIFERDVTGSALELPRSWTYEGRLHGLTKGTYRWVVWPLVGPAKRLGRAIVSAQYAV